MSVQLLLAVEDAFGFSIPDEDAAGLNTAGNLHEYVLAHRFRGKQETRLSTVAFYKIRLAMMSALKTPREDMQASRDLSAVVPAHRRRVWHAIQKTTGLRLPQLRRPAWVTGSAVAATFGLAVAVPMFLSLGPFSGALLVGILTAFVAAHCFARFTALLAFEFQPDCTTVGQLATATLARNYQAFVAEANKHTSDAEVWRMLQTVVARQLDIQPRNITKETSLLPYSPDSRTSLPLGSCTYETQPECLRLA